MSLFALEQSETGQGATGLPLCDVHPLLKQKIIDALSTEDEDERKRKIDDCKVWLEDEKDRILYREDFAYRLKNCPEVHDVLAGYKRVLDQSERIAYLGQGQPDFVLRAEQARARDRAEAEADLIVQRIEGKATQTGQDPSVVAAKDLTTPRAGTQKQSWLSPQEIGAMVGALFQMWTDSEKAKTAQQIYKQQQQGKKVYVPPQVSKTKPGIPWLGIGILGAGVLALVLTLRKGD